MHEAYHIHIYYFSLLGNRSIVLPEEFHTANWMCVEAELDPEDLSWAGVMIKPVDKQDRKRESQSVKIYLPEASQTKQEGSLGESIFRLLINEVREYLLVRASYLKALADPEGFTRRIVVQRAGRLLWVPYNSTQTDDAVLFVSDGIATTSEYDVMDVVEFIIAPPGEIE